MDAEKRTGIVDDVQAKAAKLVAENPVGHNLLLIGGFRYRFLDHSARTSKDIDYHWAGNLENKQRELLALFRKRLLPTLERDLGYSGRVDAKEGPDADSPVVRTVVISLWKPDIEYSRVEIPVEVTRVACADSSDVRTIDGTIYATLSDADQIESKIIAVFNRQILQHRDLLDIFLFSNRLIPKSPERLKEKLNSLSVTNEETAKRVVDLEQNSSYHSKAIQEVIDTQLDPEAARNINAADGGALVLKKVLETLRTQVRTAD